MPRHTEPEKAKNRQARQVRQRRNNPVQVKLNAGPGTKKEERKK